MITLTAVRTLFTAVSNVEKPGAARPTWVLKILKFKMADRRYIGEKCFVHIMAAD